MRKINQMYSRLVIRLRLKMVTMICSAMESLLSFVQVLLGREASEVRMVQVELLGLWDLLEEMEEDARLQK
jgi:hypothetical protein